MAVRAHPQEHQVDARQRAVGGARQHARPQLQQLASVVGGGLAHGQALLEGHHLVSRNGHLPGRWGGRSGAHTRVRRLSHHRGRVAWGGGCLAWRLASQYLSCTGWLASWQPQAGSCPREQPPGRGPAHVTFLPARTMRNAPCAAAARGRRGGWSLQSPEARCARPRTAPTCGARVHVQVRQRASSVVYISPQAAARRQQAPTPPPSTLPSPSNKGAQRERRRGESGAPAAPAPAAGSPPSGLENVRPHPSAPGSAPPPHHLEKSTSVRPTRPTSDCTSEPPDRAMVKAPLAAMAAAEAAATRSARPAAAASRGCTGSS